MKLSVGAIHKLLLPMVLGIETIRDLACTLRSLDRESEIDDTMWGNIVSPNLDIYCLKRLRNAQTIERFLDLYIDRTASEDREEEELMIRKLDALYRLGRGGRL